MTSNHRATKSVPKEIFATRFVRGIITVIDEELVVRSTKECAGSKDWTDSE